MTSHLSPRHTKPSPKVLHDRAEDDKKTPLQIQADARRAVREIRDMGVDVPDVVFTDSDLDLSPTTPGELAVQLGHSGGGRAVRRVLRVGFPDHEKNARWEPLTGTGRSIMGEPTSLHVADCPSRGDGS